MNAIDRLWFRLKHEATGKPKALILARPSRGTTNYLQWLRWKEKFPEAEFTSCNGLFIMIPKTNN